MSKCPLLLHILDCMLIIYVGCFSVLYGVVLYGLTIRVRQIFSHLPPPPVINILVTALSC